MKKEIPLAILLISAIFVSGCLQNLGLGNKSPAAAFISGYLYTLDDGSVFFVWGKHDNDQLNMSVLTEDELKAKAGESIFPDESTTLTAEEARAIAEAQDAGEVGEGVVFYHVFPYNQEASWRRWYFPAYQEGKLNMIMIGDVENANATVYYDESLSSTPIFRESEFRETLQDYLTEKGIDSQITKSLLAGYVILPSPNPNLGPPDYNWTGDEASEPGSFVRTETPYS